MAAAGDMMTLMYAARLALSLALVVSASLIAQAPQTRSATTVSVTGRVVDQAYAPIPNVIVTLDIPGSVAPGETTKTNQNGDFTFSAVSPREYELHFRRPGFRPFTAMVPLSKDLTLPTIVLFQSGIIDATVTAEETAPLVASPITQTLRPQSDQKEPIRTTVCELVKDPASFNGKTVSFRAEFISKFEWTGFVDDRCSAKLPIGVFHVLDKLKPEEGQYAFTTANDALKNPERLSWKPIEPARPIHLTDDDDYRVVRKYADAKFIWPETGACLDCPLYRITVTVTGRFEYFETQTVAVRANPNTKAVGYSAGDPGAPLSRLVLMAVQDVVGVPGDPTLYSTPRRRNLTIEEADKLVRTFLESQGTTLKLPGFSMDPSMSGDLPDFCDFEALWNNPGPGSVVVGHYSVDLRTGDVWYSVMCQELKSRRLAVVQRAVRSRIALTQTEYRKLRRPGPMCE